MPAVPRTARPTGLVCRVQVPSFGPEEDLVVALVDATACSSHPGYFFDFPARVVPDRQPAAARRRSSPTASIAILRHFDCRCPTMRDGRRPPPRGSAHPAVLLPVDDAAGASATSAISRRLTAWLAAGGPARAAAAADQRDGARPAVAVFGDQRDGDRSDLHHVCRRCRSSPRSAAKRRSIADDRARCSRACGSRRASTIAAVRRLKQRALRARVRSLRRRRMAPRHRSRARAFAAFVDRAGVVDRRLRAVPRDPRARSASGRGPNGPSRCSAASRRRSPTPAASSRDEILFHQYLQWLAGTPVAARRAPRTHGVALFGDLPFMVDGDSADVWARQDQFRLDASVGAPPDAFSATGQDWGMPVYRWDVDRARTTSAGCAIARGAARSSTTATASITSSASIAPTAGRETAASRSSRRPTKPSSSRSANACSTVFRDAGARHHRRGSRHRSRLRARVARAPGRAGISRVPLGARLARRRTAVPRSADYPPLSVATSGTHDTEPHGGLVGERGGGRTRARFASCRRCGGWRGRRRPLDARATTRACAMSCSKRCLRPVRTCCCCRFRMCSAGAIASTSPATVNDRNWTFRLPWPVDRLDDVPEARERQACLQAWARKHGAHIIGRWRRSDRFVRCVRRRSEAPAIAAVPYDVVNVDEARALAAGNPFSFLRVSRAELELPPARTRTRTVYERADRELLGIESVVACRRGRAQRVPLSPEHRRARADRRGRLFGLDEYDNGVIKKHERTRRDKEDDRTRHMIALGAQTGPVFLTIAAPPA